MNAHAKPEPIELTPDELLEDALALLERKVPGILKPAVGPRAFMRLA